MARERTYLDYNATAPAWPEVVETVAGTLRSGGNASSVHEEGRRARTIIDTARERIARFAGAAPEDVIFTSGGSEANSLAIRGPVSMHGVESIVISAVEHPSVIETAAHSGRSVTELAVDAHGVVRPGDLRAILAEKPNSLVSVMLANNETGVIQPIREIGEIVRESGGLLHVDAVQAAGKVAVDFDELGADLMSLSAHKIGGPHGVGALIAGSGLQLVPRIRGGGQESGRRAGTENLAGIAGFGKAAGIAASKRRAWKSIEAQRDEFEDRLRREADAAVIFGRDAGRLPNTTCVSAPGMSAQTAVIALDLAGYAVSSGSACSSGKVARSHVLDAMGVPEELARGAVRISLGWETDSRALDGFTREWLKIYARRKPGAQADAA